MTTTRRFDGRYHDGRSLTGGAATLVIGGREAALIGADVSQRYSVKQLRVSPRVGKADRFIAFPDGGQLQCADQPQLDRLPQAVRSEGPVAWLEQRVSVAIAAIVLVIGLLATGYLYGLPLAAKHVAARIPIETEQALGQRVLSWLDTNEWFLPTQIDADDQKLIRERFAQLHAGLPQANHYRLELRAAPKMGPNAFALPGGTIVMTDEMVTTAASIDEIVAVLAHEIGHIEQRHALRHLLHDSVTAIAVTTITGDAASLSVAVAAAPVLLAKTKNSRQFETEADEFGFALLKRHGVSPAAFASLMERLAADREGTERAFAFVSTHPVTADRVQRARAAAE